MVENLEQESEVPLLAEDNLHIDKDHRKKWMAKRTKTVIIFALQNLSSGLNYNIILPTLWFYLKEVNSPFPSIFYGIIFGLSMVVLLLSSIMAGWFADKTREIKIILLSINTLAILGNVIYSIGYSPYVIMAGRVFSVQSLNAYAVIAGEAARCYDPSELQRAIALFTLGHSLGLVIAPSLNTFLKDINIKYKTLHISYANAGAILGIILFAVQQILILLFVSNLSKEFDLKASLYSKAARDKTLYDEEVDEKGKEEVPDEHENERKVPDEFKKTVHSNYLHKEHNKESLPENNGHSPFTGILNLFKNSIILTIFFTTFLCAFSIQAFEVLISLVGSVILHWNIFHISLAYIAMSFVYIALALGVWVISKRVSECPLIFTGLMVSIIGYICLFFIGYVDSNYSRSKISYFIFVGIAAIPFAVERIPLPSLMAKMVPSEMQNKAEAVRFSIAMIAMSLGPTLAGVAVKHLMIFSGVLIVISLINGVLLVWNYYSLSNPAIIEM